MEDVQPSPSPVTRRTTAGFEEGGEEHHRNGAENAPWGWGPSWVGEPASIAMGDWFTAGSRPKWDDHGSSTWEEIGAFTRSRDALAGLADRKTAQFPDARFRRNLEQVEDYEKGPTYWALPRISHDSTDLQSMLSLWSALHDDRWRRVLVLLCSHRDLACLCEITFEWGWPFQGHEADA